MILCEGDSCAIKWFHFECVGLLFSPAFSWFCPDCKGNVNEIHIQQILFSLDECTLLSCVYSRTSPQRPPWGQKFVAVV